MALILAIEPDRRQAGQLTALVKGRLHAEVVIGDSAETALAALGSRVPDLVLTTALLSPKDESALSERLRALDGAAAHVQTLTIPVLATTSRRHNGGKGGVLSALLGDKSKTDDSAAPEGCDPAMFAEQCKEYLERAAAERASSIEKQHALVEEGLEPLPAPVFQAAPPYESAPAYETAPIYEPPPTYEAAPIYQPTYEAAPVYEPASAGTETQESGAQAESTYLDTFAQVEAVEPEAPAATAPIAMPQASEHRVFMPRVNDDEPPAALLAAVAAFADVDEQNPTETYGTTEVSEIAETQSAESDAAVVAVGAESASDELPSATNDLADVDLSSFFNDRPGHADVVDEPGIPVYELNTSSFDGHNGSEAIFVDAADSDNVMPSTAPVYTAVVKPEVRTWPILEDIATADPADSTDGSALSALSALSASSALSTAPAAASFARTEADELREWSDIIEALRRDAHPTITPVQEPVVSAPEAIFETDVVPAATAQEPVDAASAEPLVAAQPPAESVIAEPAVAQERVVVETAAAEAVAPDAAASDSAPADPVAKRRKGRRKGSVEDEWGFFDPDRAGFAALLAKLEEITEDDSAKPHRT